MAIWSLRVLSLTAWQGNRLSPPIELTGRPPVVTRTPPTGTATSLDTRGPPIAFDLFLQGIRTRTSESWLGSFPFCANAELGPGNVGFVPASPQAPDRS